MIDDPPWIAIAPKRETWNHRFLRFHWFQGRWKRACRIH